LIPAAPPRSACRCKFNWDQPLGIDHDTRSTINFQPVVPLELSTAWNLILRWIMPCLSQPRLSDDGLPQSGVSDIVTGASRDDVNTTFLQPFLAYTTASAVTYTGLAPAHSLHSAPAEDLAVTD
jgi:hypothetical protein